MINFSCPNRDPKDDLDNILREKKNTSAKRVIKSLKPHILHRYGYFNEVENSNRILANYYTGESNSSLQQLYESKTKTATEVINDITNSNNINICLSCGIKDSDEIDHFLPKEHFPEYSIFHKNLVPICGVCNKKKGQNIPGQEKDFFHPMFDKLGEVSFLDIDIDYTGSIPVAYFSVNPTFQETIVERHFSALQLSDSYQKKSTEVFLWLKDIKVNYGYKYTVEEIQRGLNNLKLRYNDSFWKINLYSEMLNTNFASNI